MRRDLLHLASDDLWTRTWCRQEIFAADTSVLCGPNSKMGEIYLQSFISALHKWINSERPGLRSGGETEKDASASAKGLNYRASSDIPATFATMTTYFQHAGTDRYSYNPPADRTRYTIHWLRHLRDGAAFNVSDERDRVYGVFGMISSPTTRSYVENKPEIKPEDFPISYEKTVSEVYQDVVKFLINTDGNLDCLTVFENRLTRSKLSDLPSWVTDWGYNQPRALLNKAPDQTADSQRYGRPLRQSLTNSHLVLSGVVLFSVKELSARNRVDFNAKDYIVSIGQLPADHTIPIPSKSSGQYHRSVHDLDGDPYEIAPWYMTCKYEIRVGMEVGLCTTYVPHTTRIGDLIVHLWGGSFPFVLRPHDLGTYELVGPAILPKFSEPIAWDANYGVQFVLV